MKNERLFRILGEIDFELIEDAENIKRKKRRLPIHLLATAASLFLIIGISGYIYSNRPDPSLPRLEVSFYDNGGMGFSGHWAYDISELVNSNPWTEDCELTHLPVFRNRHPVDGAGTLVEFDWEFMDAALTRVAGYLGIQDIEIAHSTDKISGYLPVSAQAEGMEFKMYHPTDVEVFLDPAWKIPKEYCLTDYSSTYEETYSLAEYILTAFPELIPMKNAAIDVWGGDYGSDGTENWQHHNFAYYEITDDETQNIINYNFNRTRFTFNADGNLYIYRVGQTDLSEILGYYPIISADEAQRLLCRGYYGTNVPEDFRGEEYIMKRELVYRTDIMQSIYVPYYLFYVELPDEYDKNGLNNYGLYYVPAVESKYIEDFHEVWNIRFN